MHALASTLDVDRFPPAPTNDTSLAVRLLVERFSRPHQRHNFTGKPPARGTLFLCPRRGLRMVLEVALSGREQTEVCDAIAGLYALEARAANREE